MCCNLFCNFLAHFGSVGAYCKGLSEKAFTATQNNQKAHKTLLISLDCVHPAVPHEKSALCLPEAAQRHVYAHVQLL